MESTPESFDAEILDQIADEFIQQLRRGEAPSVEEFAERHPEFASRIRKLFPALARMEGLKPGSAPPAPATSQDLPERIGEYRILREIGRGGMGIVYEAEQEALGRRVALKVLPGPLAKGARSRERFYREARAAAGLHHTNIVPVFDVGSDHGLDYYAMQLIPGHGLDRITEELRRMRAADVGVDQESAEENEATETIQVARSLHTGRFGVPVLVDPSPAPEGSSDHSSFLDLNATGTATRGGFRSYYRSVARIGFQVANALDHAHIRGIIHRDIKPSNLLLDTSGNIWVADFGLAKTEDADLTRTGDVVGTIRYMSPERFAGRCDTSSDVYAIGATLYELLTLEPAFDSRSRLELVEQIRAHEPATPRTLDGRIPIDLETIVLRAMAKEPRHRYPSASALAEDLRRFLDDRPIQARRVSSAERLWRWARRNPPLAASLLGVIALLAGVSVVFAAGQQNERNLRVARERDLYAAQMILAGRASESALGTHEVRRLTSSWIPTQTRDFTGWEWYHLHALGHEEVLLLHRPDLGEYVCWGPESDTLIVGGGSHLSFLTFPGGEVIRRLKDHDSNIRHVRLSPDGRSLLTIARNGDLHLRDPQTGALRQKVSIGIKGGEPKQISIDPLSRRLCVAYTGNRGARVFDLAQPPRIVHEFPGVHSCAFSPDGRQLVGIDGVPGVPQAAVFLDTQTWKETRRDPIPRLSSPVHLEWSVQVPRLALGANSGAFILNTTGTQPPDPCRSPAQHTSQEAVIMSLTWSPDGTVAATGGRDGLVRLWDPHSAREIRRFPGSDSDVLGIAWSPDGRWLAATTERMELRVWDTSTVPPLREIDTGSRISIRDLHALEWADNSRDLLIGARRSVIVNADDGTLIPIPPGPDLETALAFRGEEILVHVPGGFDLRSHAGTVVARQRIPGTEPSPTAGVASSRDSSSVYLSNRAGELWRFDRDLEHAPALVGGGQYSQLKAAAVDWKRDHYIASAFRDIAWWDGQTGELVRRVNTTATYYSLRFSPDGDQLVIAGEAAEVLILDADTGETDRTLVGHSYAPLASAYHPDGSRIATGGRDGTVRLWDPFTGEVVTVFDEGDTVTRLAWSPDGRRLASLLESGIVVIRDAGEYQPR